MKRIRTNYTTLIGGHMRIIPTKVVTIQPVRSLGGEIV